MSSFFNQEYSLIHAIQTLHASLNSSSINHILNQELFYHAQQELPYHIPNQHTPPTAHQLANKILRQLPTQAEDDQIIEQLMHRLQICKQDQEDQIEQLRGKWSQEKEKIRKSGAKVKEYQKVYEEEASCGISLQNPLTKRTVSYFEASTKDRTLDEMLSDLMRLVAPEESSDTSSTKEQQELLDGEARQLCDQLLEQFKFVDSAFNFED